MHRICALLVHAVHCSVERDDGFQWPDAPEIIFMCHVLDCHKQKLRYLS